MESTVYSWTFFNEIISHGSFHILEDSQHDLLYWSLHSELFLHWSQCVSTPWTVSSTQARAGKPMFSLFLIIF